MYLKTYFFEENRDAVRFEYRKNGEVRVAGAQQGIFLYPAKMLAPNWQKVAASSLAKARGVPDIVSVARLIVSRARELSVYIKFRGSFSPDSSELRALEVAIAQIIQETEERYGDVFTVS